MNKEIWKPIKGYEECYLISSLGRIYSFWSNKILNPSKCSGGYYASTLVSSKKVAKTERIHRLVAQAFIPRLDESFCVNHIDGDKANNKVSNLEWVSIADNNRHAIKNSLNSTEKANQANRKLVLDTSNGIYYDSIEEASTIYSINSTTLSCYLSGTRKNKTNLIKV